MHRARMFYAHYRVARVFASRSKAVRIALWFTRANGKGELVKGRR